jgi:hypothetical protein
VRADAAEADRRQAVREAARRWRKAEAIDDRTRDAVLAGYPDDRRRLGPAFRILVWIFTFVATHALFGILMLAAGRAGDGVAGTLAFTYGVGLCVLAESLISVGRCRGLGAESAVALAGLGYLLVGFGLLLDAATTGFFPATVWLGGAGLACAAAAWRWGYPLAGALAAVWVFALLARAPAGRLLWLLAGPAMAAAALRAGDAERLPPSLRRGAQAAAVVGLFALYAALHLGSWDRGVVEEIGGRRLDLALRQGPLRAAAIWATALVPVALLGIGVFTRRTLLLRVGLLMGLLSVSTLRLYVHVMPLWLALVLGGSAALAAALALRRYLHGGPERQRGGFTAEPLFEPGAGRVVEIAAAVASFSPAAAPRTDAEPTLETDGGRYGGGGASGTY